MPDEKKEKVEAITRSARRRANRKKPEKKPVVIEIYPNSVKARVGSKQE